MIASLPMYDWPETEAANDTLWLRIAAHLKANGIAAPGHLTRHMDLESLWLSPDLLLAQTCSYPMETVLRGKVQYIATPSYDVKGCEAPGQYRSVILKKGSDEDVAVPAQDHAKLPDWLPDACQAVNSFDSMSGYHALKRDVEVAERSMPSMNVKTGGHRASIIAVATDTAEFCAVDCVSWAMAQKYEPAANQVYVAGWTKQRPGLPLITSIMQSQTSIQILRDAAILLFNAVVLDRPTEF